MKSVANPSLMYFSLGVAITSTEEFDQGIISPKRI